MTVRVLLPALALALLVNLMVYGIMILWIWLPHLLPREASTWTLFCVLAFTSLGVVLAVLLLAEINFAVLRQRRPRATLRPKLTRVL